MNENQLVMPKGFKQWLGTTLFAIWLISLVVGYYLLAQWRLLY